MSIRITELDAITSLQSGDYIAVDNESTGTHKFDALNIGSNIGQNIANTYSSSASYAIGQYCLYDNNLYKCTTTISTPEAWNSSHWIQVTVGEGLYEKVDKVSGKGLSTNDFTNEYKQKLGGIEAGAEVNVQANWTETNTSSDSYIQNKPGNATTEISGFMSASDKQKLDNIEAGAEVNVQPNWAEDDSSKDDYIKNKPTIDIELSISSDNAVRNSAITAGINQVQGNLDTEIANRQNAVSGEQLARENADSALDGRLDTVEETLPNKANIDGSYDSMTVGNAEQLTTDIRANDQTPYLFRPSGGSIDIGDREYIKGIVGVSVPWNQLVQKTKATFTQNDVTFTNNGDGSWTVEGTASASVWANFDSFSYPQGANHVLLYMFGQKSVSGQYRFLDTNRGNGSYVADGEILKPSTINSVIGVGMNITNGVTVNVTVHPMFIDLTLMFGSTIADYIYSLEQATAGAGVAFFKTLFPKPYYAYNAGELKSVKGLVSHDMVGFNAWDEEWESYGSSGQIKSKNRIRVVAGASYFLKSPKGCTFYKFADETSPNIGFFVASANSVFTVPSDTHYLVMYTDTNYGTTYNHDICINLSWDGSEDGNYEPYQKWSYPLDSDLELRGIPKIENGNLYYDGDTYESDGTVTRKYGVVDLGTLTWTYNDGLHLLLAEISGLKNVASSVVGNIVCSQYPTGKYIDLYDNRANKTIATRSGATQGVAVYDTAYTDGATFKASVSGVYLVYELATPTTESADPYTSPQIVSDFGTEEYVIDDDVFAIPVGHNTDYPINLKAKVEMAPNSPDGDGDYIVRQTSGTNEYVSIANNSTISGLVSRSPVASGEDGTYVLKATISGGTVTYSWEAE